MRRREGRLAISSSMITRTETPRRQAAISLAVLMLRSMRYVEMWMRGRG